MPGGYPCSRQTAYVYWERQHRSRPSGCVLICRSPPPPCRSGRLASTVDPVTLSDYKTAVVTGASSGIGAATVESLCDRGLEVYAVARRADRLTALAERTGCAIRVLDVRDTEALAETLGVLEVDVLINNAGLGRAGRTLADATVEDVDRVLSTNVIAAVHAARAVLPGMRLRGRGHVVNVGSTAGLYPLPAAVYGASKAALHVLSMDLRLELAGTGVRITEICPGRVRTEFYDVAVDDPELRVRLKESGVDELTAADVADAIVYAIDSPWRVNVNRIELQPTEQTYGGMQFIPREER